VSSAVRFKTLPTAVSVHATVSDVPRFLTEFDRSQI